MNDKLVEKAEKLLARCRVCTVASVSEKGYPRICVLMPLDTKGIKGIKPQGKPWTRGSHSP